MKSQNPRSQGYIPVQSGDDYVCELPYSHVQQDGMSCPHVQQNGIPYSYDQQYPPSNPQFNLESNPAAITTQPSPPEITVAGSRPPNLMGPATVACLLCFWPIGICAAIAASQANAAADRGDFETANKRAWIARILIIAAFIVGFVISCTSVVLTIVYYSTTP